MRTTIAERTPTRAGIDTARADRGYARDHPRRRHHPHGNPENDGRDRDAASGPADSSDRQRPPGTRVRL